LEYGLEEVLELRPVMFQWNNRPERGDKIGLIAQETEQTIPEVVKTGEYKRDEQGHWQFEEYERWGMAYYDMLPVLVNATKELQLVVETKRQENQALQARIDSIALFLSSASRNNQE